MNQHFLLLSALIYHGFSVSGLKCFECYSNSGAILYDPNCSDDGYHGQVHDESDNVTACVTMVYDNGEVIRFPAVSGLLYGDDGGDIYCLEWAFGLNCFCNHDLCNNHLCQHCLNLSTTEVYTTEEITSTTTTEATTTEFDGLLCYSCFDCPTTDENTSTTEDPDYITCFTTYLKTEIGSHVIRGG
ncbi:unnamed protein product, partial [Meganyctiphanes norvegica]